MIEKIKTWPARQGWIGPTVAPSMAELRAAGRTLGPVAVAEVFALDAKPVPEDWEPKKRAALEAGSLFDQPLPLEKLPFEFRLKWRDQGGEMHDSLVISWEMAQTWRNYRKLYAEPIKVMEEKLIGDLFSSKREVSFFMGNHSRFRNIYMVCGWFAPPKGDATDEQLF